MPPLSTGEPGRCLLDPWGKGWYQVRSEGLRMKAMICAGALQYNTCVVKTVFLVDVPCNQPQWLTKAGREMLPQTPGGPAGTWSVDSSEINKNNGHVYSSANDGIPVLHILLPFFGDFAKGAQPAKNQLRLSLRRWFLYPRGPAPFSRRAHPIGWQSSLCHLVQAFLRAPRRILWIYIMIYPCWSD